MKTRLKMFVFLVAFGLGTSMLFLYMDWGFYEECFANGLVPSFSGADRSCTRLFENAIPQASALIVAHTPEELYEIYDIIVFGEILDYADMGTNSHYDVKVIRYLKNSQPDEVIQVIGSGVHHDGVWVEDSTIFEIGERVVLYLDSDDDTLQVGPYSFSTQMDTVNPFWYYPYRWIVVLAVAIGGIGFFIWRNRK